jgi:hypothetical protein
MGMGWTHRIFRGRTSWNADDAKLSCVTEA